MTDFVHSRYLLGLQASDHYNRYRVPKRLLDILGAATLLILLTPVLALITLAIVLESRGPVIFKQERLGGRRVKSHDGWQWRLVPFTFYKFRTMTQDATTNLHREYIAGYIKGDEDAMAEAAQEAKDENSYKLVHDPRVTRVGRVLRKLSLDELPQLMNVIKGEMSLVGPRPPIPYEVEMYSEEHFRRFAAIPGITGLWQVSGRAEIGFDDMVRIDVDYIQRCSFWLDLKILLLTIPAVLSRRGAG